MARNAPGGVSLPVQANDVATSSAVSTTIPAAIRLSFSGCATACTQTSRETLPGSGIRPSRWAMPSTTGIRITGSSLCTLRNGAPAASRNA